MNTLKFFSFCASVTDNDSRTLVYCIYRTGMQRVFKNKQNVTNNAKNWITFFLHSFIGDYSSRIYQRMFVSDDVKQSFFFK